MIRLPPSCVLSLWPEMAPLVDGACQRTRGRWTPGDVLLELLTGSMDAWVPVGGQGVVVTRLDRYPGGLALLVLLIGGRERPDWRGGLDVLVAHARALGCRWIEGFGRVGWRRAMGGKLTLAGQCYEMEI